MEVFWCNSKRLAEYLIKHGSKLIEVDNYNKNKTLKAFAFEKDDSIERNLLAYEKDIKRCMF